jgi:alginate O-acetyltransferase complex protein AlgI
MQLVSVPFLVFVLGTFALYWGIRRRSFQNGLLLVASLACVATWSWSALAILVASTGAEWLIARAMGNRRIRNGIWSERLRRTGSRAIGHARRIVPDRILTPFGRIAARPLKRSRTSSPEQRLLLIASVALNIGQLAFFKYHRFFAPQLQELLGHSRGAIAIASLAAPVGLSFWTLQKMTLTLDVWLGRTDPVRSFRRALTFVAFFPNLVSGPIERARRFLPQLDSVRRWDPRLLSEAAWLVGIGLFQKIVVADNVGDCADALLKPGASSLAVLVGLWAYAIQIYADFSGYSDMARGVAKLFGIDLIQNFDAPYLAPNLSDFWKRWHASLTNWLNDYIFNTASMAWRDLGTWSIVAATWATFLASGLWHGTGWTFLAWGSIHAAGLTVLVLTKDHRKGWKARWGKTRWYTPSATILTFHWVCLGYLFFRAPSLAEAFAHLGSIGRGNWFELPPFEGHVLLLSAIAIFALQSLARRHRTPLWVFQQSVVLRTAIYLLLGLILFRLYAPAEKFIYFQF